MEVEIVGETLTIDKVAKVATEGEKVSLAPSALRRIKESREFLEELSESLAEPIYGVNTGFGQLVSQKIPRDKRHKLQENLIKSHSAGVGAPLDEDVVRAMMILRVNSLAKGFSGIRLKVIETLIQMINDGVHPYIPSKGSLGASGDLAPLAHMASVLIGKGKAYFKGELLPGIEAMKKAKIETVSLKEKEGLALINGTQAMSALLCLIVSESQKLVKLADLIGAMTVSILEGNLSQFDQRIHKVRPHKGQMQVAENLRQLTEYDPSEYKSKNVQDAYSIRCIPQVHGAVREALEHTKQILEIEINSVTDNPLVFPDSEAVLSAGNFHGEPLALTSDYLKMALAELGSISERRTNRLLHPNLNGELPPFLIPNAGLNSGYMLAQYTAASLVSKNKRLACPSSVDSIPVSGDQEDHVSMGMNACLDLKEVVGNLKYILAVELLCGCQGREFTDNPLPQPLETVYRKVREEIPALEADEEIYEFIESTVTWLESDALINAVENVIGELE